jgi:hypothetical protein
MAISGGLSMLGGMFGGSGDPKAGRMRDRMRANLQSGQQLWRQDWDRALQAYLQQLEGIRGAKKETMADLSRLGGAEKRSVLDREQQSGAAMRSDLSRRGLGNTTVGANMQRGITSDTNRSLAGITERMAALRAQATSQYAGQEAQSLGNLGSFFQQKGQGEYGFGQDIANTWGTYFNQAQGQSRAPNLGGLADLIDFGIKKWG